MVFGGDSCCKQSTTYLELVEPSRAGVGDRPRQQSPQHLSKHRPENHHQVTSAHTFSSSHLKRCAPTIASSSIVFSSNTFVFSSTGIVEKPSK